MAHGKTATGLGVLALSACSDGGDGGGSGVSSYADLAAEYEDIESAAGSFADPLALPTAGTASYGGAIVLGTQAILAPSQLAGDLRIDVDFGSATNPVSGVADGFVTIDGEDLAGSLSISDGDLNRDPTATCTLVADMDGTLTAGDGWAYAFDGSIRGEFYGEGEETVLGAASGQVVTTVSNTAPFDPEAFSGVFAATR